MRRAPPRPSSSRCAASASCTATETPAAAGPPHDPDGGGSAPPVLTYAAQLGRLTDAGYALWDVLGAARVRNSDAVKCLTVRPTAFDKAEAAGGDAAVSELAFGADGKSPAFVSADVKQSDRPDLTAANVVIAGGRGMKNGENL